MTADSPRQSDISFRLRALEYGFRDRLHSPEKILRRAGVGPGIIPSRRPRAADASRRMLGRLREAA